MSPVGKATVRAIAAACVIATSLGGTPISARANPSLVSSSLALAGPSSLAVAGNITLIAAQGQHANAIVSIVPGHKPTVIAHLRPIGDDSDQSELVASPTRIAVLQSGGFTGYKGCCFTGVSSLFSAPFGRPLQETTAGCKIAPGLDESVREEPGIQAHYAVALDGDLLAYDSFGCVVVEDLASGLTRTIRLEATLDPVLNYVVHEEPTVLAVAGRLVAYRANTRGGEGPASIVVYDTDSGQVLYRVPVPGPEPENRTSFALQSDGTLVVDESHGCAASISTSGEPSPRPLGIAVCRIYGLTNDRLLFTAPAVNSHEILAWTYLQPPAPHVIADVGVSGLLQAAAPRIGSTEAVYALSDCIRPRVYRTDLSEPGTPPTPTASCPVRGVGHARLTRKGLTVSVRCPLGCAEVNVNEVRIGTARQLSNVKGGTPVYLEYPSVSAAPDKTIKLTPEDDESEGREMLEQQVRRLLRRHRDLYVRLDFYIPTPAERGAELSGTNVKPGAGPSRPHIVVPLRG